MGVCVSNDVFWPSDTCYLKHKCSKLFYFTHTCSAGLFTSSSTVRGSKGECLVNNFPEAVSRYPSSSRRLQPAADLGGKSGRGTAGCRPELLVPGALAAPRTRHGVAAAPPQDAGKPTNEWRRWRRRRRRWQFAARATAPRPSGGPAQTSVPSSA